MKAYARRVEGGMEVLKNLIIINLHAQHKRGKVISFGVRIILEKWFPLHGERAHSLYFCIYIRRLEV